uniref:DNA-directed RNA polymerase I subunit D n=1 Tax=Cacopsylla melanoneura TaxID=428564 RepID=A0A8D8T2L0_9HEMI
MASNTVESSSPVWELSDNSLNVKPNCRTFVFEKEGHTFGSVITHILQSYPEVDFAGYSVPHPADFQIFLRIQVKDGYDSLDILKKGIKDLEEACDKITNTFNRALIEHNGGQS